MTDRIYRAVLLRADEATMLNRDAENERETCCAHLDVFHARGKFDNGGTWRTCSVGGCGCTEFTKPAPSDVEYHAREAAYERHARRVMTFAAMLGGGLGVLLAQWLWRLL